MNFKTIRSKDPFSRVSNRLLADKRLSWTAKGVAAYLVGKPDGWKMRITDLVNHGIDGKHAIRAAVNELRAFGYARYSQPRVNGRMADGVWEISDQPIFDPSSGFQQPESEPDFQEPNLEEPNNQDLSKNDSNKKDCTKNYKERPSIPDPDLGEEEEPEPIKTSSPHHPKYAAPPLPEKLKSVAPQWEQFMQHCREKKRVPGPTQTQAIFDLLMEYKADQRALALTQAIAGGWTGIKTPTPDQKPQGPAMCKF